ncbi:MAG: hypothetical protein Q9159_000890 [Coniocarpon cinnabarinum]
MDNSEPLMRDKALPQPSLTASDSNGALGVAARPSVRNVHTQWSAEDRQGPHPRRAERKRHALQEIGGGNRSRPHRTLFTSSKNVSALDWLGTDQENVGNSSPDLSPSNGVAGQVRAEESGYSQAIDEELQPLCAPVQDLGTKPDGLAQMPQLNIAPPKTSVRHLRQRIGTLEHEAVQKQHKLDRLEAALRAANREIRTAEQANYDLERRLESMTGILATSPTKLDLHVPTSREERRRQSRSVTSKRQSWQAVLAAQSVDSGLVDDTNSKEGSVDASEDSQRSSTTRCRDSGYISDLASPASEASTQSDSPFELSSTNSMRSSLPSGSRSPTRSRPARRMRRFYTGSACQSLILPATNRTEMDSHLPNTSKSHPSGTEGDRIYRPDQHCSTGTSLHDVAGPSTSATVSPFTRSSLDLTASSAHSSLSLDTDNWYSKSTSSTISPLDHPMRQAGIPKLPRGSSLDREPFRKSLSLEALGSFLHPLLFRLHLAAAQHLLYHTWRDFTLSRPVLEFRLWLIRVLLGRLHGICEPLSLTSSMRRHTTSTPSSGSIIGLRLANRGSRHSPSRWDPHRVERVHSTSPGKRGDLDATPKARRIGPDLAAGDADSRSSANIEPCGPDLGHACFSPRYGRFEGPAVHTPGRSRLAPDHQSRDISEAWEVSSRDLELTRACTPYLPPAFGWLKFSFTMMMAIGIAMLDGPTAVLERCEGCRR